MLLQSLALLLVLLLVRVSLAAALAALAMMAAVVSCEYDSPDIRFQQTTTITNDYSEVVKALLDQTLALSKKWNSWRTP